LIHFYKRSSDFAAQDDSLPPAPPPIHLFAQEVAALKKAKASWSNSSSHSGQWKD